MSSDLSVTEELECRNKEYVLKRKTRQLRNESHLTKAWQQGIDLIATLIDLHDWL